MTATLKPKRKASQQRGFFSDLSLQEGDRLHFLGERQIEVVRNGKVTHRLYCHDYEPKQPKLQKRATAPSAEPKSSKIPPGAQWITVNPSDVPGAGHAVLIMPHDDGSATVIGGAGGKLNMLHLNKLKSPEEWREKAKQRAKDKKQKQAEQEAALTEDEKQQKADAQQELKEYKQSAKHKNALETIETLEKHGVEHGLTDEHKQALQQPPEPGADPEQVRQWQQLSKEAVRKVKAIHQAYEHKLVTDHEALAAAKLGDEPIVGDGNAVIENRPHTACDSEGNDLAQLVQLPGGGWLARSDGDDPGEVYQSWADAAKAHVRNVLETEQSRGMESSQPDSFYSPRQWVKEAKSEALPEGFEFKAEAALEVARLSAERKASDKASQDIAEQVEKGNYNAAGLSAQVQRITDEQVISRLESEAKTLEDAFTNDSFLKLVDEAGDADKLERHSQVGGYAKLAEIASDVLKQNPISRSLVDTLGHNEAAKVLAYQMRQALTPQEYEQVTAAQAAYHAQTSSRIARATADRVMPMLDRLKQIHNDMIFLDQFGGSELTPEQQIQMDTLAYDARSLHDEIQKTLGSTLGQLQASAAMVAALESNAKTIRFTGDPAKRITENLPEVFGGEPAEEERSPSIFDSYGLTSDDYQLFEGGQDKQAVQINESGLQKLAVGYNPEDRAAYDRAVAIKRGDFDEENYSPAGFSYYAKASFSDASTESQQFDTSFEALGKLAAQEGANQGTLSLFGDPEPTEEVSDQEVENGLRSYIGARVGNGENPLDVMNDVRSPEFYSQQGLDPYGSSALRVQNVAAELVKNLTGGDRISDKAVQQAFQELGDAEAVKQRRARQTDDLQTLHAQTLDNGAAIEAGHRTLAAMPMARTVFKDWPDLTGKERRWLREYAITSVLGQELKDPPTKKPINDVPEEVAEEQYDLFGNKITAAEALGKPEEESPELSQWQEFSKLMGGDAKAYAAVRDHLRGKFMQRFANAYSAISGKPPLIGGENVAHIDRLLLAKMPEDQRNEMLEFLRSRDASDVAKVRSRSGGKFAAELDADWLAKYEEIKGDNRQISLLAADTGRSTPKTDYQRTTLGKGAESQLHQAMQRVIPNFEQLDNAVDILPEVNWGKGTAHATKQRALKFLESQKKIGLHFGAGCVHGSTILRCEKTGLKRSFAEWWLTGDRPWVKALDESTGQSTQVQASPVFVKAYEDMYRVTLDNGSSIIVTAGHRFLGRNGWIELGAVSIEDEIAVSQAVTVEASSSYSCKHRIPTALSSSQNAASVAHPSTSFVDSYKRHWCDVLSSHQTLYFSAPLSICSSFEHLTDFDGVYHVSPCEHKQKLLQRRGFSQCQERFSLPQNKDDETLQKGRRQSCSSHVLGCYTSLKFCSQWHGLPCIAEQFGKHFSSHPNKAFASPLRKHQISFFYRLPVYVFLCLLSILDIYLDEQSLDALSERETVEDFGCHCFADLNQYDAPPLQELNSVLNALPLLGDVPVGNQTGLPLDDWGKKHEHIRFDQSIFSAVAYSKILKIEKIGASPVFDITVPRFHNYLAHGIWNHNSGKSAVMLGSFTHLHNQGKVKKMIVAVPSSIVGQFVGEAVSFLEPGKYSYTANLGMNRDERLKHLSDLNTSIFVTTRESLTNDLLHLVEKHTGIGAEQYRELSESQQRSLMLQACKSEGIDTDKLLLAIDEAHDITSRKGVDPSKRSLALNTLGYHASHYIQATGDAIKNDLSEMYNFLHSVAPDKFNDQKKFLSEYGADTQASRRALQRAIAPYSFAASTKPRSKDGRTLKMNEFQPKIPVSDHIASERQRVLNSFNTIRDWRKGITEAAKAEGRRAGMEDFAKAWDVPAVREAIDHLGSQDTWGQMSDEQKQAAIAGQVAAMGGLKDKALWRLYHRSDYANNPKAQYTVNLVKDKIQKEGKGGIVFSSSSQAAAMLAEQMKKQGIRVGVIDGSMNSQQKNAQQVKFQGENPEYDALVVTDACRTGVNLTRGKFLVHFDIPQTEMGYSQRSARIHRLKQNVDTEVYTPMLDAPEERIAWARMERKGSTAAPLKARAEAIDDSGLARAIEEVRRSA